MSLPDNAQANGEPVQQPSSTSSAFTPEQAKFVSDLLEQRLNKFEGDVRRAQSEGAKANNAVQQVLAEFNKYRAQGLSAEAAEAAIMRDREAARDRDLMRKMAQKLGIEESADTQVVPGRTTVGVALDAAGLLQKYELSGMVNDARVQNVLAQFGNTPELEGRLAILKYDLSHETSLASQPGAESHGVPSEPPKKPLSELSPDDLWKISRVVPNNKST